MSAVGESENSGTMLVRDAHRFDQAALAAWMTEHVDGFRGPLTVEQFKGGQSNPTYKLITPGRAYVLRRKPPGQILAGAHAVEREARVLKALDQAGFPVAHVYALCTDETVIGSWFYIMDFVDGRIFWDATFPQVGLEERSRYFDAMNDVIARLHGMDYRSLGLGDFGKPSQYLSRQIARWSKQYLDDADAGRDRNMDELIAWLPEHVPAGDDAALIHGDFRCDNMIFDRTHPKVLAVLDWELSTLGHPLADFTYHAMMYRTPPRIVAGLGGADLAALGIPSEANYVAAYCRRTGRDSIPHYEFYIAFNFFRLAAIFHGIKGRAIRGTAASAHALERGGHFPELAKLAMQSVAAYRSFGQP
ncbi:MAG TPA: phosphotransferase family protein [Phenylobacterium sp.]|uniref:phosphotransferase family protein n=1 Tax=Phenylobacterium sp. TaxID=1871053 RepID=UPI002B4A1AC3|nr:phosphotransferase family protein [Phenylobacterium sp.]HKR90404.1 phosphotransferase family protein [Phenylobacterium sp.]